jgi:hypothetical protein
MDPISFLLDLVHEYPSSVLNLDPRCTISPSLDETEFDGTTLHLEPMDSMPSSGPMKRRRILVEIPSRMLHHPETRIETHPSSDGPANSSPSSDSPSNSSVFLAEMQGVKSWAECVYLF